MLLGVVTLGIAFLWVIPMIQAALTLFHDDLKKNRAAAPEADAGNGESAPAAA